MRLTYKVLLFVVLQMVIIIVALAGLTLQIGKRSITEKARYEITNELTNFGQAALKYFKDKDIDRLSLNKITKRLSANKNIMYFVLHDSNFNPIFSQSNTTGVSHIIKRKKPKEETVIALLRASFSQQSLYSMQNELITEIWQDVREVDRLYGYVRIGIKEQGIRESANHFTKEAFTRIIYADVWIIYASILCTFIFARWLERPLSKFQRNIKKAIYKHQKNAEPPLKFENISLDQIASEFENALTDISKYKRDKTELISTLSHELKSPLQAIKGYTQYLRVGMAGSINPEVESILKIIESGANRFGEYVNNINYLMNAESSGMQLSLDNDNIERVINEVYELFKLSAERQRVTLAKDVERTLESIPFDQNGVHRVLCNLVSNSLKFTPPGGRVEIIASDQGNYIMVSVKDTGIGIPKENQEQVFEKFYKVKGPYPKYGHNDGLGIGLAICKALIEKHGGKIWIESEIGEGTKVSFILPKKK